MKTLIWDVETTDLELAIRTYDLKNYTRYFNPDTIKRDWSMLGAAWMFLDDDKAQAVSVHPDKPLDDYEVIKKLHSVLSEADILIGHNSDNFDLKKFNTRAIYYDLPPISPKQSVDTLKIARKYFKFTSNRLSYICEYLKVGAYKDNSPNWRLIIDGCPKELRYMRKYNKQDVLATKALYLKLRSYHHTHPNMNNPAVRDVSGELINVCKKCQSGNVYKVKVRYLASGRARQQYQCQDCGAYSTGDLIK